MDLRRENQSKLLNNDDEAQFQQSKIHPTET